MNTYLYLSTHGRGRVVELAGSQVAFIVSVPSRGLCRPQRGVRTCKSLFRTPPLPHQSSSWDQRCLERPQEGRLEEDLKLENHHCLRTKGSQSMLASMELDTGSSKRMNLWFVPREPQEGGESQPSRQRIVCTMETCVKSSPHWGRQRGQADLWGRRTHDPHIFLILSQESQ